MKDSKTPQTVHAPRAARPRHRNSSLSWRIAVASWLAFTVAWTLSL